MPFELHIFERGPHGLSLADQSSAASVFEVDDSAAQWVNLAEVWLRHRLSLSLPATPPWFDSLPPEHRPSIP